MKDFLDFLEAIANADPGPPFVGYPDIHVSTGTFPAAVGRSLIIRVEWQTITGRTVTYGISFTEEMLGAASNPAAVYTNAVRRMEAELRNLCSDER
jgi:hypothetical protein